VVYLRRYRIMSSMWLVEGVNTSSKSEVGEKQCV
jgi:hypothetical protein